MSVNILNSKADTLRSSAALLATISAAKGLYDILKSNLGPKGTFKMLVSGSGSIKITKDGNVLLSEMMIMHPTATILCRAATAMDEITGDGTTSNVLFASCLLKNSEEHILYENVHPKFICDGFDVAREEALKILDEISVEVPLETKKGGHTDWEMLECVAKTCIRTKLNQKLADVVTSQVVEAIKLLYRPGELIDLFMLEILQMKHKLSTETKLIRGMVLDHGARHPDMPKLVRNAYILTLNCSLEYEKSEVFSGFFYSNAEQRDKLASSERRFTDEKVEKILELKRKVCQDGKNFVLLNHKGIDPIALDMLAKENIIALRRIKRRNMERLILCCGGNACNSVDNLTEADLGFADLVYEETLGEEKYTFVEGVKNPLSCTILIKAPNDYSITQIKDAVRDGIRAINNSLVDGKVVPGAGAFEIAAYSKLKDLARSKGVLRFGVEIFAESLLCIPKILADNAALDSNEVVLNVIDLHRESNRPLGIDLETGQHISPSIAGIWDNYCAKRQTITIASTVAQQLLLVDEIIKAGKSMKN